MDKEGIQTKFEGICVEDVMKDIKENAHKIIETQHVQDFRIQYTSNCVDDKSAGISNIEELEKDISIIESLYKVSIDTKIRSHRKYIGTIIVFLKKIIRKVIGWYLKPYFRIQTQYNAEINKCIADLRRIIYEYEKRISLLEANEKILLESLNKKDK